MNLTELFQHETDLFRLAQGETLFTQGAAGDAMYVLMAGSADILVNGKVVENAQAGALFGEMSMIDNAPHSASVVATSDCQLLVVDPKRFSFLIQQTPKFAIHVMHVMAERLRNSNRSMHA